MPKVSIVVPVYNPGKYLYKCLDSLCGQTLEDIEIICVNDCSPDDSIKVLEEYASRDKRIIVIDSPVNRGAAISRNEALKLASGEFVAFVDSDDFIDNDFCEKLYAKAISTGADIVKGDRKVYNPETGTSVSDSNFWAEMNANILKHKAYFYGAFTSAIYKLSLVREHDIHFLDGLVFFEDSFFTIMATLFNEKTELELSTAYYYTNNPASVCNKGLTLRYAQNRLEGTRALLDLFSKHSVDDEHYIIVHSYLLLEMLMMCATTAYPESISEIGSRGVALILSNCKFPEEISIRAFQKQKSIIRKNAIDFVRKRHA